MAQFMANEEAFLLKYVGDKLKVLAKDIGTTVVEAMKPQAPPPPEGE